MPETAYIVDDAQTGAGYNWVGLATITVTNFVTANKDRLFNKDKSSALQATAKTGLQIDFNLGSAMPVNTIGILGHLFTSGATITLLADDNAGFATPDINEVLTWAEDQIFRLFSATQSYQYWRITIADAGNVAFPWIGEFIIGQRLVFTFPVGWGVEEATEDKLVIHETDYGVKWIYDHGQIRTIDGALFHQRTEDEVAELKQMVIRAKGSNIPVLFFFDTENYEDKGIYGRLTDELNREFMFYEFNNLSALTITEQPSARMVLKTV
jgi:hypothetical protein